MKLLFNVYSTMECMNILLTSNLDFTLWETILLEWERCNILDSSGEILACPPKPIEKFTFGCLTNLKEKDFKKLARGLISKRITLCD